MKILSSSGCSRQIFTLPAQLYDTTELPSGKSSCCQRQIGAEGLLKEPRRTNEIATPAAAGMQ
jgi:hypothetical protein